MCIKDNNDSCINDPKGGLLLLAQHGKTINSSLMKLLAKASVKVLNNPHSLCGTGKNKHLPT